MNGCLIEDARQIAKLVVAALLRQRAEVAASHASRKFLKACDAIGKTAREQKRKRDAQKQDKERYFQEIPAHLRQRCVDFGKRRCETNNDGRRWRTIEAHGPIHKITIQCMAVADRLTCSGRHSLSEFGAIRM